MVMMLFVGLAPRWPGAPGDDFGEIIPASSHMPVTALDAASRHKRLLMHGFSPAGIIPAPDFAARQDIEARLYAQPRGATSINKKPSGPPGNRRPSRTEE